MDRLDAMAIVIAVTETGSFSAASRKLGTPVATISRKVSELEARLNAELFQRSSRRMTLTDAGLAYIEACRRIIEQVDDAEREVSGEYRVPKGDLAVTAPWGLGHMHLLPVAVEFLNAYPEINLRLVLSDRVVNMVDENIDVAIRIGTLPDSSMLASRIGSIRLVICGSPSYLAERGTPQEPSDLTTHDCIGVDSLPGERGTGEHNGGAIAALCEHVRGRYSGRYCGRGANPCDVLQDGCRPARGSARDRVGRLRTRAPAGPYPLCTAKIGTPQAAGFPELDDASA